MALEKLLSQIRSGLNIGLITLASALPSYTAQACNPKNPEQQAQQTYNSFSKEKKSEFERFFDVDYSRLGDFELSFLQDAYRGLFEKETFDVLKMTLPQKLKIFNHTQKSDEKKALQTYNSFSQEERKKFDYFFDDVNLPDDIVKAFNKKYHGLFLVESLFLKESFDIRDMTFSQKMKMWEYQKERDKMREYGVRDDVYTDQ